MEPIKSYFEKLRMILVEPHKYFRQLAYAGGHPLSDALLFTIITHWIGSALQNLWQTSLGHFLSRYSDQISNAFLGLNSEGTISYEKRNSILDILQQAKGTLFSWIWGTGSLILDPFFTLIKLSFTGLIIFIAAKLIIGEVREPATALEMEAGIQPPSKPITYESILILLCYATAPIILSGIPLVGGLAASLYAFILTVIAIKEYYKTSNGKSVVVALFPQLLLWTFVFIGILLLTLGLIGIASSVLLPLFQ